MSLRYGWICIRCHFPMSMFLRLGNAGWYCVTKGSIFLRTCTWGIHIFTKFLKNLTSTSKKKFFQNSLTVKNIFL